jgi:hypothetical protein
MFKLAATFDNPGLSQTGFPTPGSGAQSSGPGKPQPRVEDGPPVRPTKGFFSWLNIFLDGGEQRGFPSPLAPDQRRPRGSMPNVPDMFGGVAYNVTPDMDRGASAFVPITGKVLTNPIGAGIPVPHRPQASYGPAGEYADGMIFWTTQQIPTSVNLNGLTSPQELAELLDGIQIQAVVRTQ